MRRYAITCEFYRAKRANAVAECIRRVASEWERPLSHVWIVNTSLSASELRSELLSHLDFQDRIYICEAGADTASFNVLQATGRKVTQIEDARVKSRMLTGIFSRDGNTSRHLRAATAKNLKSA